MTDQTSTPQDAVDERTLDHLEQYAVEGDVALGRTDATTSLAAYPGLLHSVGHLLQVWRTVPPDTTTASLRAALQRRGLADGAPTVVDGATITRRIGIAPPLVRRPSAPIAARPWRGGWRIAGVVFTACVLAVVGLWRAARTTRNTSAVPSHVYRTVNGQYADVALPDGSHATLGPATTLAVATGFGGTSRTVSVSGEAYFTVGPDARIPFLVHAGSAVVRVLGTTFTVRRYPSDSTVRVAVNSGRVLLRVRHASGGEAILPAATIGVASDSGQIVVTPGAADNYQTWRDGTLHFRDTPLRDVLGDLGRAYDVDIASVDTALATQIVTLTVLTTRESLSHVLDELMLSLGAHYTRTGRTITIAPGRARAVRKPNSPHLTQEHTYGR